MAYTPKNKRPFKVGDKVRFATDAVCWQTRNKQRRDDRLIGTIIEIRGMDLHISFTDGKGMTIVSSNNQHALLVLVVEGEYDIQPKTELEQIREAVQKKIETQIQLVHTAAESIQEAEAHIKNEQEAIVTFNKDIDGANRRIEELNEVIAKLATDDRPFRVGTEVSHRYYGLGRIDNYPVNKPGLIHVRFFNRVGIIAVETKHLTKIEMPKINEVTNPKLKTETFKSGDEVIDPIYGKVVFVRHNPDGTSTVKFYHSDSNSTGRAVKTDSLVRYIP